MHLTRLQVKAVWFIVLVFTACVIYYYADHLIFKKSDYDFSHFDSVFTRRRDSLRLAYRKSRVKESQNVSSETESNVLLKSVTFPLNVNNALSEELQMLPRIGPIIAERIIDHRQKNGLFQSKRDIMDVRGIGPKTFQLLDSLITVE